MPTTNEAIAVLKSCKLSPTLTAYYMQEINLRRDNPKELETVIDAIKLSAQVCKNLNEVSHLLAKSEAQISNLQQSVLAHKLELKNKL